MPLARRAARCWLTIFYAKLFVTHSFRSVKNGFGGFLNENMIPCSKKPLFRHVTQRDGQAGNACIDLAHWHWQVFDWLVHSSQ
eukprot:1315983-Prymnesium_polylepis.1